ncbi:MAG TPA: ABC transporter permease [Bacilli bacterium]|nr:ABC transporter permease [Bacilli bacterium]HOH61354.1 ABC transporter permease [Bacilli bacterium]HQB95212.1 ABC transporter permease [Bacilli bacterium]HQM07305.1 ABC transporter permease [Bacilli bacterium]HQN99761.1 ABC transporter permease [Bacilli bacterium]
MRDFWIILKASLINSFALNKIFKNSQKRTRSIIMMIIVAIASLAMIAYVLFYLYFIEIAFVQGGKPEIILQVGIVSWSLLSVVMTITRANGYLFKAKDFELLMTLPVKPQAIIASKLVNLLIVNYLIIFYTYVPALIIYTIFNPTGFLFWVLAIVAILFIPLLSVALCGFIAYFIGMIPIKRKFKNLATIIFSLVFVSAVMLGSMGAEVIETDPQGFTDSVVNILNKASFLAPFAFSGIRGNIGHFLIFVVISVIPFLGFIWLVGRNYHKTNTTTISGDVVKDFKLGEIKAVGQTKAILNKEIKKYFGTPMYLLNTSSGPLLSLIILILMIINTDEIVNAGGEMNNQVFTLIIIGILTFMVSLTSTTSCSLSLEGKNFWIIKSAPIPAKTIFMGKILVNIIVTIPIIIIDTIVVAIFLKFNLFNIMMIALIPSLFAISISFLGLYANLLIPRFDYDQEIKAIKQSISVLVTMAFSFIITILLVGAILLGLVVLKNISLAYLFVTLLAVIITAISYILISTHGVKLYDKLNC